MKTIMKKVIAVMSIVFMLIGTMAGCAGNTIKKDQNNVHATASTDAASSSADAAGCEIPHRYADAAEGVKLRMANTDYFDNLTQNDLDYRVGKRGATLDEFKALARAQGGDFTEEDKQVLDASIARLQARFDKIGFDYPLSAEIMFVKSKMDDELGAIGYTHKNQIYLASNILEIGKEQPTILDGTIAHELFHVLSRSDPKFRQAIYSVLGFTIADEPDFTPKLRGMFVSNPDVKKFDSYATFNINGKPTKAVVVTLLNTPYKADQSLFDNMFPAIVPYDKPDTYYTVDQVPDFWNVFGKNTNYVSTTEEAIANNFSDAVVYGMDGRKYQNPKIIQGMLDVLANYKEQAA